MWSTWWLRLLTSWRTGGRGVGKRNGRAGEWREEEDRGREHGGWDWRETVTFEGLSSVSCFSVELAVEALRCPQIATEWTDKALDT